MLSVSILYHERSNIYWVQTYRSEFTELISDSVKTFIMVVKVFACNISTPQDM